MEEPSCLYWCVTSTTAPRRIHHSKSETGEKPRAHEDLPNNASTGPEAAALAASSAAAAAAAAAHADTASCTALAASASAVRKTRAARSSAASAARTSLGEALPLNVAAAAVASALTPMARATSARATACKAFKVAMADADFDGRVRTRRVPLSSGRDGVPPYVCRRRCIIAAAMASDPSALPVATPDARRDRILSGSRAPEPPPSSSKIDSCSLRPRATGRRRL